MPVQLASFLIPKNGNTWFVVEDKFIKGGMQVVASAEARDAINPINMKPGMLVVTQSDNKLWQLQADSSSWVEFSPDAGGASAGRKSATYTAAGLQPGSVADFVLPMGKTVLVLTLKVSTPCMVQCFSTAGRGESNPYTFVATADHLEDDGSSLMTDGTILRGRRYSIFSNLEVEESIDQFFRISNAGQSTISATLDIEYIVTE